jgi:hypothetical protein
MNKLLTKREADALFEKMAKKINKDLANSIQVNAGSTEKYTREVIGRARITLKNKRNK